MKKKALLMVLAAALIVVASVGGTLAWLTDSDTVINSFTVGKVDLELYETDSTGHIESNSYVMVPGTSNLHKDPTVTVAGDSEDCYLFVELIKPANSGGFAFSDVVDYTFVPTMPDTGWTPFSVPGESGRIVYVRMVHKSDAATEKTFSLLKDNQISIKSTATNVQIAAFSDAQLNFKAYAVQQANVVAGSSIDYEAAWNLVKSL